MKIPNSLTVQMAGLTMDGGSVTLLTADDEARPRTIKLEWSIKAQREGTTHLLIDGVPVPKQSAEESAWIQLIESAEFSYSAEENDQEVDRISPMRAVLASDADAMLRGSQDDMNVGLRSMRDSLLQKIQSPTHGKPRI